MVFNFPLKSKLNLLLLTLVFFVAGCSSKITTVSPYKAAKKDINLFLIGNSFSGNASTFLPQLAEEGGHKLTIGRAELGGCSLQRHWTHAEAFEKDPNDPKGKPYKGKSLKMLLSEGKWDVVTIQQNSMNSSDYDTYQPYAEKLIAYIKSIQPDAEIVIHQTWAYRSDAKSFGQIDSGKFTQSAAEMYKHSRASYHQLSKDFKLKIIPSGDAFYKASTDKKFGYKPDTKFDFKNPPKGVLPEQNYSLHVGHYLDKTGKLKSDYNHAGQAGCYLAGLTWYAFLFNESPTHLKFLPKGVSSEYSDFLKSVALETVKQQARSGS